MVEAPSQPRYLSQSDVARLYTLSRQAIIKFALTYDDFPKPVRFFSRAKRYLRTDIEAWFDKYEHAEREPVPADAVVDAAAEAEKKAVKSNKQ